MSEMQVGFYTHKCLGMGGGRAHQAHQAVASLATQGSTELVRKRKRGGKGWPRAFAGISARGMGKAGQGP